MIILGTGDGDGDLSDELLDKEFADIGERILMRVDCSGNQENTAATQLPDEGIPRIDSFLELNSFSSRSQAGAYSVHEGIDPLVEEI